MQPIIRLYKIEDFEPITRLWFDAQTVAMPKLMKRMNYEFEDACEFFSRVVICVFVIFEVGASCFRVFAILSEMLIVKCSAADWLAIKYALQVNG